MTLNQDHPDIREVVIRMSSGIEYRVTGRFNGQLHVERDEFMQSAKIEAEGFFAKAYRRKMPASMLRRLGLTQ